MYGMPDQMSQIVRASLSNQGEEYFQAINMIDEFRQNLAAIDENLQEVQNIMQGYKNALMPPEPEAQEQDNAEWAANEQAEYEKFMAQVQGSEEGFNEEG